MPEFDSEIQEKIEVLREISNNYSEPLEVYQLLKISWAEPDGVIYYAATNVEAIEDDLPVEPVQLRLPAENYPEFFLPVSSDSTMGDEEISLKIWDGDDEISRLVHLNGEGIKVEVLWWFPNVGLLLSDFWGHLRTSQESDIEFWIGKAANGFRSPNLKMPRRGHYITCQETFGQGGCIYDRHRGGAVGNLNGGVPFTSCPKKTFQHCIDRIGDKLSHLSHQTVTEAIVNNQTKGPALLATSRGNETNLKRPVRVVMGRRYLRDLDLMAALPQYNTNHPDKGFWRVKFELCEGPITGALNTTVNGQDCLSAVNAPKFSLRTGQVRQAPTAFTTNTHNYSGTAHFDYTYGWVNPSQVAADSLKGESWVDGLNNIRQYSDEDSFTEGSTTNRAWQIARMLTDKRWGYGLDTQRLSISAFIEVALWAGRQINFTEPETGAVLSHIRSCSHVELNERTTQQQIEDMCWAGRFSRPFLFQGKLHILPLRALTEDELAAAPVFTDSDEFGTPNIIWENEKTTVRRSQISDEDLANRIELTFDEASSENKEQIVTVEDEAQQLRAGAIFGDTSIRVVAKQEAALGVVIREQAIKLAWTILDLGKFDEGGLQNNLEVKFKGWFLDCLNLHPFKVIKVVSSKLSIYGFEYFRVKKINRLSNLQVEIVCQAYNKDYMNALETDLETGGVNFFPGAPDGIAPLTFGSFIAGKDYLEIGIEPSFI